MNKREVLKKFLDNSCTAEEAVLALQYMQEEPWLLDELLSKQEWDDTETALSIPEAAESAMWQKIAAATPARVFSISKPLLVAAAILSALFIGIFMLNNSGRPDNATHLLSRIHQPSATTVKENHSSSITTFILADNSSVKLFPGSSVEYITDFVKNRTIKLNGKAIFSVTKNAQSPFVVYSGVVRTTALGTRFSVDNCNDIHKVTVKLFEGRVVVQPVDPDLSFQETYLIAGQQCFVDVRSQLVKINSMAPSLAGRSLVNTDKYNSRAAKESLPLIFSKTPLSMVLNTLQTVYRKPIRFNPENIIDNYFTGSFSTKDSLSTILQVIAVMNELNITVDGKEIKVATTVTAKRPLKAVSPADIIKPAGGHTFPGRIDIRPVSQFNAVEESAVMQHDKEQMVIENGVTRFTGISLPQLLDELQKQSGRKIYFNRDELSDINFTGAVLPEDGIRAVLSVICRTNGLTLAVKKGAFYISKSE